MVRGKMTAATEKKEKAERVFLRMRPENVPRLFFHYTEILFKHLYLPRMASGASSPLLPY